MTFPLLTTSDGVKMGKTAKGALWLDPEKTSPFEFYQYWRNVEDDSVEKCFKLLTFLPIDEIEELTRYRDNRINDAKVRLAYEITKLVHGEETAETVKKQALAAFSNDVANMPVMEIPCIESVIDILVACQLCKSKGEARRLIEGGGVSINDKQVKDISVQLSQITNEKEFVLHKGKKVHIKVVMK